MKLNPDCVRDILLTVEENTTLKKQIRIPFGNVYQLIDKYDKEEVAYHIKQCELYGYLHKVSPSSGGSFYIDYLSPAGHELLENIRADTNWHKTREIAKKVGSESLNVLAQIAAKLIGDLVTGIY